MVESYLNGEFEPIMAALADDVTIRLTIAPGTPLSGTFHGKEGVGEYFSRNAQTVDANSMEVLNYLAGGGQVAVVGRETLTVRKSGAVLRDADWVMLCTFRDEKISEILIVEDTSAISDAYRPYAELEGNAA
jgi:ketosteroid isomerase-like protein